jgi:flagellar basal body L-ring protein FlgH
MKKTFIFVLLLLESCAQFVEKIHQQIDYDSGEAKSNTAENSPYGKLKTKKSDVIPIKDPITYTLTGEESTENMNYAPVKMEKRFKAADFTDTEPSGSLWAAYDDSTSFFSTGSIKQKGEIVVIDVMESLKNTISKELRGKYPLKSALASQNIVTLANDKNRAPASQPSATGPASAEAEQGKEKEKEKEDKEEADIIYDKITTKIFSEVDKDHSLIKGRKEVYFRNRKRLVEIQAIVKKADIDSGSRIKSDSIIESKVTVLQ